MQQNKMTKNGEDKIFEMCEKVEAKQFFKNFTLNVETNPDEKK